MLVVFGLVASIAVTVATILMEQIVGAALSGAVMGMFLTIIMFYGVAEKNEKNGDGSSSIRHGKKDKK